MKKTLLSLLLLTLMFSAGSRAQSCGIWNGIKAYGNGLVDNTTNLVQHVGGGKHVFTGSHLGSCYYQNPPGGHVGSTCITTVQAIDTPTGVETPPIDISLQYHEMRYAQKQGTNSGVGAVSTSGAEAGVAVESCLKVIGCNYGVSLGPSGVTVSSGSPIWTDTDFYNGAGCPAEVVGCPLIIDTIGEGIQLTNARDGVVTDMVIPGKPMRFGWTKKGSHNGFLWVDGHIFGNQMGYSDGYAMLAAYDTNGDGIVDAKDGPAFDKFRVWIDTNHDGAVQPGELHTLASLGFPSIPLAHIVSKQLDANGNLIYDKGAINTKVGGKHTMIDAFLTIN